MTEFFTHTNTYAIATVLLMVASWTSFAVVYDCKFAQVEEESTGDIGYFGLYMFSSSTGRCQMPEAFDDFMVEDVSDTWWRDHYMNIARVSGSLSNIIANGCWIAMWIGLCANWSRSKGFRIACGVLAFVCAVLSGFVYWALDNEICHQESIQCSLSRGSLLNIFIIVVYVVTGFICLFIPEPHLFTDGVQQVIIEKTEHKDGSVFVKKTTVNRDGTKFVEERHADHLDNDSWTHDSDIHV